jgi:hypothetical protein
LQQRKNTSQQCKQEKKLMHKSAMQEKKAMPVSDKFKTMLDHIEIG